MANAQETIGNMMDELDQIPMYDEETGELTDSEEIAAVPAKTFRDWLEDCGLKLGDINILIKAFKMPNLSIPTLSLQFLEFFASMGPLQPMPQFPDWDILIDWEWPKLPKLPKLGDIDFDMNVPFPQMPTFSLPPLPEFDFDFMDLLQPFIDLFMDLFSWVFEISLPKLPKLGDLPKLPGFPNLSLPQFPTIGPFEIKLDILEMLLGLLSAICDLMPWPEI